LWRHGPGEQRENGAAARQSNTRLVKWSDGSMQLHVANDVYEISTLKTDNSFIYCKQANHGSKNTTVLECHGQVNSRFSLRLGSIDKMKSKTHSQTSKRKVIGGYAITEDTARLQAERDKMAKARAKSAASSSRRPRPSMRSDFLEYDEDNVTAIKSHIAAGGQEESEGSFVEEDDEEFDEEGAGGVNEEEDEEDDLISRGHKKRPKSTLDEDDDDDA